MNNKSMAEEHTTWYSTYGLVTLERVFGLLNVHFTQEELHIISSSPNSPYHQLIQVPLKYIFTGIIISQANDYREFAQKMLVDYLLSGAANLPPEQTKPEGVQLELEVMRQNVITASEQFDLLQFEHYRLINESQRNAIETAKTLPVPRILIDDEKGMEIRNQISPFLEQADDVNQKAKTFRKQFQQMILKIRELLETVPDFYARLESKEEHMEALYFDAKLGEETE